MIPMAVVDIMDLGKNKVGQKELPEKIFGATVNRSLLHEEIVMQTSCMRQGTASTKRKGEVRGGGRKPWRQKGTGRARAGSTRSPLWRGGGSVFGPRPRDYSYSIPQKKARAALYSALTSKVNDKNFIVVDRLDIAEPKTKQLAELLRRLDLSENTLIITEESDGHMKRAAQNIPSIEVLYPRELNVYTILRFRRLLISERALDQLVEVWSS